MIDEILELLRAAQKVGGHAAVVDAMQSTVQDGNDAQFMLKWAKRGTGFEEIDELKPDMLHGLLGLLRTSEDLELLLDGIPQERVGIVESRLKKIRDELLRGMGQQLSDAGKELTRRRAGRPPGMPPDEICRSICRFIVNLNSKEKVGIVDAQKRAASKWRIKFRTIERIWSRRNEFLADDENQPTDS